MKNPGTVDQHLGGIAGNAGIRVNDTIAFDRGNTGVCGNECLPTIAANAIDGGDACKKPLAGYRGICDLASRPRCFERVIDAFSGGEEHA